MWRFLTRESLHTDRYAFTPTASNKGSVWTTKQTSKLEAESTFQNMYTLFSSHTSYLSSIQVFAHFPHKYSSEFCIENEYWNERVFYRVPIQITFSILHRRHEKYSLKREQSGKKSQFYQVAQLLNFVFDVSVLFCIQLNDQNKSIRALYQLYFNNQFIYPISTTEYLKHIFLLICLLLLLLSFSEFRRSWFESIEYNGGISSFAARHWALYRTLFDTIGKWCAQFGKFTFRIQFNTGIDWSLR